MSANLSPEYLAAEEEYRSAGTVAEKIAALERMFATLPKHKGTEKMQADIKRRLSQARKESQKKGASHALPFYFVPREGAGQVALVGPANSGQAQHKHDPGKSDEAKRSHPPFSFLVPEMMSSNLRFPHVSR